MLEEAMLMRVVERIVKTDTPKRIILFGSYARGDANEDSDLDLLIIKVEVHDKIQESILFRSAVGNIGLGVDILVFSEKEIEEKKDWCTSPVYWALMEGRILYAA